MSDIRLDQVSKAYPNGVRALADVSLHVEANETLALVGPSGCGKTTLLRVIAGLEEPSGGAVYLGGRDATHLPPHERDVAMVFQRPALVPNRTVRENLGWSWALRSGLFRSFRFNEQQEKDLREVAALLGIDGLLDRRASDLSGGQQQRVALGRALLKRAGICLLDEPLGHLEAAFRTQLRRDLRLLSRQFPATMIHVTHDPAEALAVGDRVAVLHNGQLQQVGSPESLVRQPANRFVAELCHTAGPMSFLDGRLTEEAGRFWFVTGDVRFEVASASGGRQPPESWTGRASGGLRPPLADLTLGLCGETVKIQPAESFSPGENRIMTELTVTLIEFAPQGPWVTCRRGGVQVTGRLAAGRDVKVGQSAMIEMSLPNAFWFETSTGATLWAPTG